METKAVTRRYDLDWLRVMGILTVFIYHSGRFFQLGDLARQERQPPTLAWMFGRPSWQTG